MKVEVESNIAEVMQDTAEEMREGMFEVTEFIAISIQQEAQEHVPFLTGLLHDDIKVQREAFNVSPSGIYGASGHAVVVDTPGGPDTYYGLFMEFGFTKRSGDFYEPTPWLRPAAWNNANKFEQMSKAKVTRVVGPIGKVTRSHKKQVF